MKFNGCGAPPLAQGVKGAYDAAMGIVFDILILVAILGVAIVLGFGIYSLFRGGDYARSNSNRLMRLRVVMQATAVVLLMAGLWWRSSHGG